MIDYESLELSLHEIDSTKLARLFAKGSVAYDELESLGNAFFGNIGIGHPNFSDNCFYGNGLSGEKLLVLVNSYKSHFNDDRLQKFCFNRNLAVSLRGEKGTLGSSSIIYYIGDNNYVLKGKNVTRILTFTQVADAYLSMAKEEYEHSIDSEDTLPNVRVIWSESNIFKDNTTYSVKEFDSMMRKADLTRHAKQEEMLKKYGSYEAWQESGEDTEFICYEKTKFKLYFKDGSFITERMDIGDGIGGLVEFMESLSFSPDRVQEIREAAGRVEKADNDPIFVKLTDPDVDGCGSDVSITISVSAGNSAIPDIETIISDAVKAYRSENPGEWDSDGCFDAAISALEKCGCTVNPVTEALDITL